MLGIGTIHYFATLCDSKKGSMTNRNQCAIEHFKNDVKYGYLAAAPIAAGVAGCKTPQITRNIGNAFGKSIVKIADTVAKLAKSDKVTKYVEKIAKHPTVLGLGALGALGLATTVGALVKHANNKGRIDQKYEDAAKIESQTKNVVLEMEKKFSQPNYAEMCI